MKKILALTAVLGLITEAKAQSGFDANLDPFQEVPPHNTPGYGSADLTLSGTTLTITAGTGLYADLLAGATAVKLADAPVGMNGSTINTFNLDTAGNTSGTFSGSVTGLTVQQITDLNAGSLYLNIADSVFPSGEIRGQILPLPEPSTMVFIGMAGLFLGWRLLGRKVADSR